MTKRNQIISSKEMPQAGGVQKKSATATSVRSYPKSFRLKEDDLVAFKSIVKAVNQDARTRVSETKVLQALIHIGSKLKTRKIIDSIKELMYN